MRFLTVAVAVASLAAGAIAVPVQLDARGLYPLPTDDPFYQIPTSVRSAANGQVLKSRQISTAYDVLSQSTYQVQYKTTGALGEADATVATLFAPKVPSSPPKIMLLMAPVDSANPNCEVSYGTRDPTSSPALYDAATVGVDILAALSNGWYVAMPDHEGSKAAFISGVTEALAGLDGLRALLNFRQILPDSTGYKAIIHGYSGGGHASAWATQFARTYGKGVNIIAGCYGGVPVDLLATLQKLNKSFFASFAISALAGMSNQYPELKQWLLPRLYPNGTAAYQSAKTDNTCNIAAAQPFVDVYSYIKGGEAAISEPIPTKYFDMGKLGQPLSTDVGSISGVLPVPVFQYHSASDEIVPYPPVPGYVANQCSRGAHLQFSTTAVSEHLTAYIEYIGDTFIFMKNAFDGNFGGTDKACSTVQTIIAPIFSPAYIAAIGPEAYAKVLSLQGSTIQGMKINPSARA
ncbi:secretory lipase [Rhodotorula toruloides]|uniref:triacylglycerol lipase n=1 Tax=Rhodotorula toruloides TaxID=5286 RepID=A0A511KN21_RHOTO|nr:secretory lipase [Rhodotorula toruloides]